MADRYWVGGTGTWDASTTTNWATTSGGAGGASAPTSADNAYFDGNSDSGAPFTVTLGTGAVCADVIIGDGSTVTVLDQTMTLAGSANWTVSGSIYFPATSFTRTYTGQVTFNTSGTKDITLNGVTLTGGTVSFNASGTYNFQSAATLAIGSASIYLRRGTLNTNNFNITGSAFVRDFSGGVTVLNLGSSTITCTHNNNAWAIENSSDLTLNAGTSTIAITSPSVSSNSFGNGLTYNNITITSSTSISLDTAGGRNVNNTIAGTLRLTSGALASFTPLGIVSIGTLFVQPGSATGIRSFLVPQDMTIVGSAHIQSGFGATFNITDTAGAITAATVNAGGEGYNVGDVLNVTGGNGDAQLTVATLSGTAIATVTISTPGTGYTTATGVATTLATSALNPNRRLRVVSNTFSTVRTITAAAVNITNADIRDITGAGAATWSDSGRTRYWGNCLGNSGITFSAGVSKYRIGTGNWSATQWSASSGGAAAVGNFPLAQDTCVFDANTTTGTHTLDAGYQIGSLNMSALTSAVTLATGGTTPAVYGNVTLDADVTLTGTGTITFAGQGITQTITSAGRTFTQNITVDAPSGTVVCADNLTVSVSDQREITLIRGTLDVTNVTATCFRFRSDNSNTRSIAFGASGRIVASIGNGTGFVMTTMTNFSYTGTSLVEISGNDPAGTAGVDIGTNSTGTSSNAINLLFSNTGNARPRGNCLDISFSPAYTGKLDLDSNILIIRGSLTLQASMASTMTGAISGNIPTFSPISTSTITSAGKIIDFPVAKSGSGTLQLADNLTMGSTTTFTLTQGTLDLNDKILSTGTFSSSNSNVRSIDFGAGGKLECVGSGTVFNATTGTNLTTTGTGTIDLTSASTKTFAGGGRTYPTLNQGGSGTLLITGANTFADITNTVQPTTITFPSGVTTSVQDFSVGGALGNLVTLNASTPGTRAILNRV